MEKCVAECAVFWKKYDSNVKILGNEVNLMEKGIFMATWNIGIDETGVFDCFSAPNPNHPSFVCAVVTRMSEKECEAALKDCARLVRPALYSSLKKNGLVLLKDVIGCFFHARKISDPTLVNEVMISVRDNKNRTDFFEKIFISQENTDFVGNPQNYYLNSLYEVLSSIFESKLFSKGDDVNVFFAQRASEVTGYEAPAEIIVNQLYKKYFDLQKKNSADPDLVKINEAVYTIFKYGYKTTDAKISKSLTNRWMLQPDEHFLIRNAQYLTRLESYHKKLAFSIQKFLDQSYPGYKIKVEDQSANEYIFPAMADIACTLVKDFDVSSIKAKKRNLVRGFNIRAFIEDGDFSGAANLIGELFYDGMANAKNSLTELFESIACEKYDSLWQILIDICVQKMRSRGIDGDSVLKTGDLIGILDVLVLQYCPSDVIHAHYLKMKGEYAAHSGSIDISAEEKNLKTIERYIQNAKDVVEYTKLLDLYQNYLIENLAQVQFNSYDFRTGMFYETLEKHKLKMESNPFFFRKSKNGPLRYDDDFIDNQYSVICGTIGQMHAFSGEHDKAIEFFLEDYNHTNFMKFMVASFLVVEYLRKEDLETAIQWFNEQQLYVAGQKKPLIEIGEAIVDIEKIDMWLALNYLRLWALSMKQGKPVFDKKLSFEKWLDLNLGDYPWALVLKWAGVCNCLMGGSKQISIDLLEKSIDALTALCDPTFSNASLVLPQVRILENINENNTRDYKKIFADLCEQCETFKLYVASNQKLSPKYKVKDVWDAAMIMPFNYA